MPEPASILVLSGGVLEFFGIILVAAPVVVGWGKDVGRVARKQTDKSWRRIRQLLGIKRTISLSGGIHAKSKMRASAFVFRDVTQPTAVPIPRLERAVALLQEQMRGLSKELAPSWRVDSERISGEQIARLKSEEINVLKASVSADLSLPRWRQAGVGILLLGVIFTISGSIVVLTASQV